MLAYISKKGSATPIYEEFWPDPTIDHIGGWFIFHDNAHGYPWHVLYSTERTLELAWKHATRENALKNIRLSLEDKMSASEVGVLHNLIYDWAKLDEEITNETSR